MEFMMFDVYDIREYGLVGTHSSRRETITTRATCLSKNGCAAGIRARMVDKCVKARSIASLADSMVHLSCLLPAYQVQNVQHRIPLATGDAGMDNVIVATCNRWSNR